jgi:Asp-tRNA(Asn)/Glu-tRNA(Gln) amidotransferase A subunit family amidase
MGATPSSPFPDLPSYGGLRPFDLPEVVRFTAEPDWRERLAPNARPGSLLGDEAGAGTAETEERRRRVVDQMRGIHERYDVLLTPTIDQIAPLIPDDWGYPYGPPGCSPAEAVRQYVKYTMRANLAGCVAASVPAGFVDGMPVGLQVIGRPGEELTVLRVARALEQILPWAEKRPPIVDGV